MPLSDSADNIWLCLNSVGIIQIGMTRRFECMRPEEIRAVLRDCPWVFVPIGAMEWHGHHNPIGLDGLKAHGQLLRVAEAVGGVVYPPIYTGHFTGDEKSPHTYMIRKSSLLDLLTDLLNGFEKDGFQKVVLLSGHYPNHLFVAHELQLAWQKEGHAMKVLSLRESQVPGINGDHAGRDETSMMLDLEPGLVRLDTIQGKAPLPEDTSQNWIDTPLEHPCHGVVGFDPRHSTAEQGHAMNEQLKKAIIEWIQTDNITVKYAR